MTARFIPMLTACCTLTILGTAWPAASPAAAYGQGSVFRSSGFPTPPAPPMLRRSLGVFVGPGAEARQRAEENRRRDEEHRYLLELQQYQQHMQQRVEELERRQRESEILATQRQFEELRRQSEQRLRKQREFQQEYGIGSPYQTAVGTTNGTTDVPLHPAEVRRQNQQLVREARAQGRRLTPAEYAEARQRYAEAVRAYANR